MTRRVVGKVKCERQVWKPEVFFTSVFFPYTQETPLGGRKTNFPTAKYENMCKTEKPFNVFLTLTKNKESDKDFHTEIAKSDFPNSKISSDNKVSSVVGSSKELKDKRLGCLHTHIIYLCI